MTKVQEKGFYDFFSDQLIGGRSAIRLANSACGWAKEIAGKTNFIFWGCELDTAAISKNWLKPLDNQIYVVKGVAALFAFPAKVFTPIGKYWDGDPKSDFGSILKATQHTLKTIGDSAAGLRCLTAFGFVFLSPYVKFLGLAKNSFAVGAGIAEIACRVYDLHQMTFKKVKTDAEARDRQLQWMSHWAMIITQIFSIQLNFFGGCCLAFADVIEPDKHIPEAVFNFWGTSASLSALVYSSIEYIR